MSKSSSRKLRKKSATRKKKSITARRSLRVKRRLPRKTARKAKPAKAKRSTRVAALPMNPKFAELKRRGEKLLAKLRATQKNGAL